MRNLVLFLVLVLQIFCSIHSSTAQQAVRQEGFYFTNPLLDCQPTLNYIPPFREEVKQLIDGYMQSGKAKRISLYFRQLNNGYSFGIYENQEYAPASMLKVGDMMYVLLKAQQNRDLLSSYVKYDKRQSAYYDEYNVPTNLKLGESYTVSRLIADMIILSDNESIDLLEELFDDKLLWEKVFKDLGVNIKRSAGRTKIISPKLYSKMFRVLYNASYLNREMSGIALDLLCNTTFDGGIKAGVNDKSVQVANKYGSRITANSYQLHETAIVYLKGNPYLVSIMTEGADSDTLNVVIKETAALVHSKCAESIASTQVVTQITRSGSNRDTLLSPLLDCTSDLEEIAPFSRKVVSYIDRLKTNDSIDEVSIYFRHLSNGQWFAINGDRHYSPGSLSKLPTLISLMHGMESSQALRTEQVKCHKNSLVVYNTDEDQPLVAGKSYSIVDLLERMVIYQDDVAMEMVQNYVSQSENLWQVLFDDIGIDHWPHPNQTRKGSVIVRDISLLFRVLYNATILNRNNSEMALRILIKDKDAVGIQSGLPQEILTAAIFGELVSSKGKTFVHDCGIVYYEDNPYQLCVLTEGDSAEKQSALISEISRLVFEEVSAQIPFE